MGCVGKPKQIISKQSNISFHRKIIHKAFTIKILQLMKQSFCFLSRKVSHIFCNQTYTNILHDVPR